MIIDPVQAAILLLLLLRLSLSLPPTTTIHAHKKRALLPAWLLCRSRGPPTHMPAAPSVIIINHHQHKPERAGGAPWALALNHTGPPPLLLRLDDGGPLSRSVLSVCCLSVAACCLLGGQHLAHLSASSSPQAARVRPPHRRMTAYTYLCGDQVVLVRVVILPWRARPSSLRPWRRRRPWCGGS